MTGLAGREMGWGAVGKGYMDAFLSKVLIISVHKMSLYYVTKKDESKIINMHKHRGLDSEGRERLQGPENSTQGQDFWVRWLQLRGWVRR